MHSLKMPSSAAFIGMAKIAVCIPEDGARDVPVVVGRGGHIDLDGPNRWVVQVLFEPLCIDDRGHPLPPSVSEKGGPAALRRPCRNPAGRLALSQPAPRSLRWIDCSGSAGEVPSSSRRRSRAVS